MKSRPEPDPAAARRPRVALIVETSVVYGREILEGVAEYVRGHRPWSVFVEQRELGRRRRGG